MKKNNLFRIASAAVLMLAYSGTYAQTTSFTVDADVVDSCNVSATNLDFLNYDPLAVAATTGSSTITVTCSTGTAYDIALDAGGAVDTSNRTMTSATTGDSLNYVLQYDADGAGDVSTPTHWGNTTGTDTVTGTGSGTGQDYVVLGTIPANQNVAVGTDYTNTINVEIVY